jgi:hypothetical protein
MQTDMSPIDDSYDSVPARPSPSMGYYQEEAPQRFFQPPQQQQQFFAQPEKKEGGFFAQFDKSTWFIIGLLVLIAFFMGKTMQPVILKA